MTTNFKSSVTLGQNEINGPVFIEMQMEPTASPYAGPVPQSYSLTSALFTAINVNLIQEGIELLREKSQFKYNVTFTMEQQGIDGEIASMLSIDPIDLDGEEAPISYIIMSGLLAQMLEEIEATDEDGNPIAWGSAEPDSTVH